MVNIADMPIKCPVAPLEFAFLADWFFQERGIRDKVEIYYVTPMSGAFTKPKASAILSGILEQKHIHVIGDFFLGEVNNEEEDRGLWWCRSGLRSAGKCTIAWVSRRSLTVA